MIKFEIGKTYVEHYICDDRIQIDSFYLVTRRTPKKVEIKLVGERCRDAFSLEDKSWIYEDRVENPFLVKVGESYGREYLQWDYRYLDSKDLLEETK